MVFEPFSAEIRPTIHCRQHNNKKSVLSRPGGPPVVCASRADEFDLERDSQRRKVTRTFTCKWRICRIAVRQHPLASATIPVGCGHSVTSIRAFSI